MSKVRKVTQGRTRRKVCYFLSRGPTYVHVHISLGFGGGGLGRVLRVLARAVFRDLLGTLGATQSQSRELNLDSPFGSKL